MKLLPRITLWGLVVTGLAACHRNGDDPTPIPHGTGLTGSWQLTRRICYCPPTATPNEMATFTATTFAFFKNNQPTRSGNYADTVAMLCGYGVVPVLRLRESGAVTLPTHAALTLHGDTLVLDYGSPCDAARDTYRRL